MFYAKAIFIGTDFSAGFSRSIHTSSSLNNDEPKKPDKEQKDGNNNGNNNGLPPNRGRSIIYMPHAVGTFVLLAIYMYIHVYTVRHAVSHGNLPDGFVY